MQHSSVVHVVAARFAASTSFFGFFSMPTGFTATAVRSESAGSVFFSPFFGVLVESVVDDPLDTGFVAGR